MDRRSFLNAVIASVFLAAAPLTQANAAGETTALLKLVKGAKSNDNSTIGPVADEARKIGWAVPTTGSQVHLIGSWKFISSKKDKGEIEFKKGGTLSYGGASRLPFTSWQVYTSGGKPALLALKGGGSTVVFQYFQRPGVAALSNLGNRKQWIVLTVKP